ncbi:MAG: hypothetical protein RL094_627 [Candidatus Parcubacteria bacterium]|jgi:23S rRNA (cytosine1962-C5)-methyltransferase
MKSHIFIAPKSPNYELLDSGDGMKLERYDNIFVARPDPQALWKKSLSDADWNQVHAIFEKKTDKDKKNQNEEGEERGNWILKKEVPEKWEMEYGSLIFNVRLTPFKHTGIFPEQLSNWDWCSNLIKDAVKKGKTPQVLNLFGYSGGATLAAAAAGASVTHVDASRAAMNWANENAESSGLKEKPIRWMLDDAAAFVKREIRRGKKYDAIIMDPPAFGRGAKGEIWKIEESFLSLFDDCMELLTEDPLFFVINGYAAGYSSIAYENNLYSLIKRFKGHIESGELTIQESGPMKRLLPCGIVSRWCRE